MEKNNLDLLIKNGHVLDAYSGLDGVYSLGIKDGKLAGIYPPDAILPSARSVLDAQGAYISAGWIDVHTHIANHKTANSIDADTIGVQQGVTTVVDAGSAGSKTFADFEKDIAYKSQTRILSWINIAGPGLYEGHNELADIDNIDVEATARLIREKPIIRGIKVRMSRTAVLETGTQGLVLAKKLARQLQVPVFVHVGNRPPKLEDVLNLLDAGDVVTHIFHGKPYGCLDAQERILPELLQAVKRGIYLDVGHGTESFSFSRFKQAREQGLSFDTISTDLYYKNYLQPVHSLKCTMEKFLALGLTLHQVLAAVTLKPAEILRLPWLGRVKVGAEADLTMFRLVEKKASYVDAEGQTLTGQQQFAVQGVVRAGKVLMLS